MNAEVLGEGETLVIGLLSDVVEGEVMTTVSGEEGVIVLVFEALGMIPGESCNEGVGVSRVEETVEVLRPGGETTMLGRTEAGRGIMDVL